MGKFILVKYGNKYIGGKEPALEEIAGHFDIKDIQPRFNYSLHTEYSYSKRKFDSPHLKDCNEIKKANYNGIPMLWLNENWAKEFAKFIKNLTNVHFYPAVIEIHPPYINYSETVDKFLNIYRVFEEKIVELFPEVKIVIENRFNTMYNKSSFLISKIDDLKKLAELIETNDIKLRIVLDIPQLFSVHNIGLEESRIIRVFEEIKKFRKYISGIHIWGKIKNQGKRAAAHYGDLNSFFQYNLEIKNLFLNKLKETFDDEKERYLVLEVNSGLPDFLSIYNDIKSVGFNIV